MTSYGTFDICQLGTPGPFGYFCKTRCLQKIKVFSMKEQPVVDEAGSFGGQMTGLLMVPFWRV